MLRFAELENLGLKVAAITEKSDGDCGRAAGALARARVCEASGCDPGRLLLLSQVHGTGVLRGAHPSRDDLHLSEGDAFITNEPGLPVAVRVADCVPVLMYDPVRHAAGVAHAGREGTLQGIALRMLDAMGDEFGSKPSDVHAVVGPSAGPCCYEVSEEMATAFAAAGWPTQGRLLDLWSANRLQLERGGVPAAQVYCSEACTICGEGHFSYRGDATLERNMAMVCL